MCAGLELYTTSINHTLFESSNSPDPSVQSGSSPHCNSCSQRIGSDLWPCSKMFSPQKRSYRFRLGGKKRSASPFCVLLSSMRQTRQNKEGLMKDNIMHVLCSGLLLKEIPHTSVWRRWVSLLWSRIDELHCLKCGFKILPHPAPF